MIRGRDEMRRREEQGRRERKRAVLSSRLEDELRGATWSYTWRETVKKTGESILFLSRLLLLFGRIGDVSGRYWGSFVCF